MSRPDWDGHASKFNVPTEERVFRELYTASQRGAGSRHVSEGELRQRIDTLDGYLSGIINLHKMKAGDWVRHRLGVLNK